MSYETRFTLCCIGAVALTVGLVVFLVRRQAFGVPLPGRYYVKPLLLWLFGMGCLMAAVGSGL